MRKIQAGVAVCRFQDCKDNGEQKSVGDGQVMVKKTKTRDQVQSCPSYVSCLCLAAQPGSTCDRTEATTNVRLRALRSDFGQFSSQSQHRPERVVTQDTGSVAPLGEDRGNKSLRIAVRP